MATTSVYSLVTVVVLLLLLGAAPLALAGEIKGPIVQECAKTAYPETCVSVLSNSTSYGDTDTATPLGLATVAVGAAGTMLDMAASTAKYTGFNYEDMPVATDRCLSSCGGKFVKVAQTFHKHGDVGAWIARVRKYLADAKEKGVHWNCGECLSSKQYPYPKDETILKIDKGGELDQYMAVLPVLLDHCLTTK